MFAPVDIRRVAAVVAVVAALGTVPLAVLAPADARSSADGGRAYLVVPGDTVWRIAELRYPDADPRQAVWRIRERNGLDDAALSPGQRLVLP